MRVVALVGLSGTGKSYKASGLASEKNITHIIDDGLLIEGTRVVSGKSAKKEQTRMAAVRRALFMDPAHVYQVKEAIEACQPESILILGTSVNMVNRIVQRLGLPIPEEIVQIQDISSEKEILAAKRCRKEEGKHVIPVPTFAIRKQFSGYFIAPLKIFRIRGKDKALVTDEKTVVRPTYSYLGKYYIADTAIEAIAVYNAQMVHGVHRVLSVRIQSRPSGIMIRMDIAIRFGPKVDTLLENVQAKVAEDITRVTDINVIYIHVQAKSLVTGARERINAKEEKDV